jgi:hypothetical protein
MTHDLIFGVMKVQGFEVDDDLFDDEKLGEFSVPLKTLGNLMQQS